MQRLEVSGAVRPIYGSLGVKRLIIHTHTHIIRIRNSYCFYTVTTIFTEGSQYYVYTYVEMVCPFF